MRIRPHSLLLCLLLAASGMAQAPAPSGEALATALQDGVWCTSEDDGKSCAAYDEFHSNGTLSSCGQFSFDTKPYTAKSSYNVNGRTSCVVVTETTHSVVRPGDRFCVDVLEMTGDLMRFRIVGSAEVSVQYRRPKTAKRCPGNDV